MIHSLTIHDTPEENGVSKCLNHMLLEHAHAMYSIWLAKFLWTETIQHATGSRIAWEPMLWWQNSIRDGIQNLNPTYQDLPQVGGQPSTYCAKVAQLEECTDQAHWVDTAWFSGPQGLLPGKRHVTTEHNITFDCALVHHTTRRCNWGGIDAQTSSHTSSNIQLNGAPETTHMAND